MKDGIKRNMKIVHGHRKAPVEHPSDVYDLRIAERRLKAMRAGKSKTVTLDRLMKQYGLAD
jgi:RHH-type rel operon transcriptional repressor/antitoxin RelB